MFKGCGTALVTPFTRDRELDLPTLRKLVQRQIDAGIDFVVPMGTTGESPTLELDEHLRVVEVTLEVAKGKVPVVAGCGGYYTKHMVDLAERLEKLGADGLLSVTPYYNKPTPEGLYQHYKAIAAATKLPIILYSVAGRTARNIAPAEVPRLASIPNVVAIKEASGSIAQMGQICQLQLEGFDVLAGDDSVTLPLMALGGVGVISVCANQIPGPMSELCAAANAGDFLKARAIHRQWQPLMEVNFCESSPGPVKYAMAQMGLLEEVYRLPMVPITAESKAKVDQVLASTGLV